MQLKSLTIEYLNRCNLNCAHCAVSASSNLSDKVRLVDAKEWVAVAKRYGITELYISGGEPFLEFEELCDLVKYSHLLGIKSTVYTNAFWATSPENTRNHLLPLRESGLDCLHTSLDCFHEKEGISLQNLVNVASVAREMDLKVILNIVQTKDKEIDYNFIKRTFEKHAVNMEYSFAKSVGRASELSGKAFIREKRCNMKKGCRYYANPLISAKGEVFACGGAYLLAGAHNPLKLGNVHEIPLSDIIERFFNLKLMHSVATFGPFFLYELVAKERRLPVKNKFSCICEFCSYLLNDEENARIIQKKLENPDPELRFKLKLAELAYKNIDHLSTGRITPHIVLFCDYHFPTFIKFARKVINGICNHRLMGGS